MDKRKVVLLSCLLFILTASALSYSFFVNAKNAPKKASTKSVLSVKNKKENTQNSLAGNGGVSQIQNSKTTPKPITTPKAATGSSQTNSQNASESNSNTASDNNQNITPTPVQFVQSDNTSAVTETEPQITITPTPTQATIVNHSNTVIVSPNGPNQCNNVDQTLCPNYNPQNGNSVSMNNGASSGSTSQVTTGGNTNLFVPTQ